MDKKVLIIGACGLIGSALYEVFLNKNYIVKGADKDVVKNRILFCDITRKETLDEIFSHGKPNIFILTAALNDVDYCEEHPDESKEVNIQGLKNILHYVNPQKDKFIYFSSDYIFDGLNGPYSEESEPRPLCVYGKHKLLAEKMIKETIKNYLIIRTTWVYGPEQKGKNFVLSLIRRLKSGQKVKVPFDQIGSPTYSKNLAEAIEELVGKNKGGIYNIVGPELLDRFTYAREICDIFGLSKDMLIPVPTKDLGQRAKRPLKAGLKIDKIEKEISIRLLNYREGLTLMKCEAIKDS